MQVAILPFADHEVLLRRLAKLPVTVFDAGLDIKELGESTAGLVYVAPFSALADPRWPRTRVALAQTNRRFVLAGSQLRSAEIVSAVRDGASDVVIVEEDDARWLSALEEAEAAQQLWLKVYVGALADGEQTLCGQSVAMKGLRRSIERLGPTDINVLILGESGAGKERVAMALHEASRRETFVAVNCAAIPKDLLESELFGVEKGAYTGANRSRMGLVEQASRGTLFLDEIGEIDINLAPKLLRYLETRVARRVGSEKDYEATARIVSATNRDLQAGITANTFRADLFYRLSEITLQIPPLRQRPEDIAVLAIRFLRQANERFGKNFESIEPGLLERFSAHPWPGNARELKSAIDRLVLLFDGPLLREGWWEAPAPMPGPVAAPGGVSGFQGVPESREPAPRVSAGFPEDLTKAYPTRIQRLELARRLLSEGRLTLTEVAAHAGVHPTTLFRWRQQRRL